MMPHMNLGGVKCSENMEDALIYVDVTADSKYIHLQLAFAYS